jgi:predicted short-subunit dehydrogenase-like oxidoreductase (DUF2520 family)
MKSFSLVGAGRLGSALAAALAGRGWKPILIVDTSRRARREARGLIPGARTAAGYGRLGRRESLVIISVPDAAVAEAAAAMAGNGADWRGKAVVHTSGMLTSKALAKLRQKGASTASMHPAQSFPARGLPAARFRGVNWTVEGDGPAVEAAGKVIRALKGRALVVPGRRKPLLHLACSLASNGFSSLEAAAFALLKEAGFDRAAACAYLLPLMRGTLSNMEKLGIDRSLSGPVVRGDVGTVRGHLDLLKKAPALREVYVALSRNALRMVPKGALPPARLRALKRLLGRG